MDDRETLIEMLDRAGVAWEESEDQDGAASAIAVSAKTGDVNLGYSGFFTHFGFNEDGSLKHMGAWE
jgi:hypothetical protein